MALFDNEFIEGDPVRSINRPKLKGKVISVFSNEVVVVKFDDVAELVSARSDRLEYDA